MSRMPYIKIKDKQFYCETDEGEGTIKFYDEEGKEVSLKDIDRAQLLARSATKYKPIPNVTPKKAKQARKGKTLPYYENSEANEAKEAKVLPYVFEYDEDGNIIS